MTAATETYRYAGMSRAGVAQSGQTTESPAVVAKRMFDRGYRWLRITNAAGTECGGITRDRDTGGRIWWGEDAALAAHERALAGLCSHGGHGYDGETCSDIPV